MTETPNAAELLMGLVNRQAMEIAELPREEREATYRDFRAINYSSAIGAGRTEGQAQELADNLDKFVREAVRIMEASGGASGGRA